MQRVKQGRIGKHMVPLIIGSLGLLALTPLSAYSQNINRDGFEGNKPLWVRGESNVRVEEKEHRLSSDFAHGGQQSEYIKLLCPARQNEACFAYYFYPTLPTPITEDTRASVYVKSSRAGARFLVRVVLPRERNPQQIDEPLTMTVNVDIYRVSRRWQKLELNDPLKMLKNQQQNLRVQLGHDIDLTDAYIDRLILNLYTDQGELNTWIDDLEIGPVKPFAPPPGKKDPQGQSGITVSQPKHPPRQERGYPVRMEQDKLFVDEKPFFFRAIRYSDTPLKTLRDAGFNTVWFEAGTPTDTIEEAIRHGFWIVPSLPLLGDTQAQARLKLTARTPNDFVSATDVESLASAINRFSAADGVLFWDVGGAIQIEKQALLARTIDAINRSEPRKRPFGSDVWDGFELFSNQLQLIGTHRYPLWTSLNFSQYRDWLSQRGRLSKTNSLHWTWIQTHIPDWQTRVIYGKHNSEAFKEPIGPQPEQIRILTYLGLAAGCRGLAFSSDRFLADSHQGRDRLLMLALLNQEIIMLEPLLLSLRETPYWIETSDKNVKAAILRCEKGLLVLPIWLGDNSQFVTGQGAISNLSMVVPLVPDGTQPWEISPGRVQSLQYKAERRLTGMRIVIPEFDLTSAVVFTADQEGIVSKWQNHARLMAPQCSQWARDLAAVQLEKVKKINAELVEMAPQLLVGEDLIQQSERRLRAANRADEVRDYMNAYLEGMRATRPLRIVMRGHWEQATRTLDFPSASPYTVSYFTLPMHWKLYREMQKFKLNANLLRDGDFEPAAMQPNLRKNLPIMEPEKPKDKDDQTVKDDDATDAEKPHKVQRIFPKDIGVPVTVLPSWTVQQETVDAVELYARLVPSEIAIFKKPEKKKKKKDPYRPSNGMKTGPPDPPEPTLEQVVLRLNITPKIVLSPRDNKPLPAPQALERTYLAVNTPAVRLQPDSWVRVSAWIYIPEIIKSCADGLLFFDNICGEGMGLRLQVTRGWKQYHIYRKVPANGLVWATFALTGIGNAYVDDVRIEPLE